ncbi:MAG TPA: ribonuclease T2 [Burkholderiaceae bacterium]|nr:ribonuclease T2 [Burkholderiaceae bacterium]
MNPLRALGAATLAWAAAALLLAAAPACALPEAADAGSFDDYVLALSWSPTFCASHPGDYPECSQRRGFVVHGLWPHYAGGGGPEHCGTTEVLDPDTVERAKAAMPDERLIHHEWVVHGSCSGLSPHDYFITLIRAVARPSIPSEFDGSRPRRLTAPQIVAAFVKENPSMSPRSLALRCTGDELEEVRICLSRDLHPQPCGRDVRSRCPAGPLRIGATRPPPPG